MIWKCSQKQYASSMSSFDIEIIDLFIEVND